MPSKNPEINKRARDKWYKENKKKQIARQGKRRAELKKWFWNYKRTLHCVKCGFIFLKKPECCDFHHIDSTYKKTSVGIQILSSKQATLNELKKCIPLCACCHRTKHKKMYSFS